MKLTKDEQLLDLNFRAQVIQEIKSQENVRRKMEALKRHELYRDRIKKWVMESLSKERLNPETLQLMENRASSISLLKKVINKIARLYVGGINRDFPDSEQTTERYDQIVEFLKLDEKMKKAERYRELFKNCMVGVLPEKSSIESEEGSEKFKLKCRVLAPWQYDVIEDQIDREVPRVVILSEFTERNHGVGNHLADPSERTPGGLTQPNYHQGNRKDEAIADSPEDSMMDDDRRFIWWNKTYHFTTDSKGGIIPELSPEDGVNPIDMMPWCNLTTDQDGEFWAQGGEDLVEGTILMNVLITDMNSIANVQGWGQPVVKGTNLAGAKIEGGPNRAIMLEYDKEEDGEPDFDIVSANPPLGEHRLNIEQYVALLLTTNNLSPSNVATNLSARDFPSGIAMLIEHSESTGSTADAEESLMHCERMLVIIVKRWLDLHFQTKSLTEAFNAVGPLENTDIAVKFEQLRPPVTEKEMLENLKARKELGINTMVELILKDNPDLTEEQAEQKLKEILEEKLKRQMSISNAMGGQDGLSENAEEKETPEEKEEGMSET